MLIGKAKQNSEVTLESSTNNQELPAEERRLD